jgi:Leucine-rich repeat (LRR) protein
VPKKEQIFRQLTFLDLYENKLSSIPSAFKKGKSLEILNLDGNLISEIPTNAFGNNTSLKKLFLNNLDPLSSVTDCAFCGLTGLKVGFFKKRNTILFRVFH